VVNGNEMVIPYRTADTPPHGIERYDETRVVHQAPHYYVDAPGGHSAFGAQVHLRSCLFADWAGADAVSKTLIGRVREVQFKDFILPWSDAEGNIRRAQVKYVLQYCIVVPAAAQVQPFMLDHAETIRRASVGYLQDQWPTRVVWGSMTGT